MGIKTLNPDLKILAPIREWKMSREEDIDYAKAKGLEITVNKDKVYSIDANLWGAAIEGGTLEDPWQEPDEAVYLMTIPVSETPDESIYVEIGFEHGLPVKLNDKEMSMKEIIGELNELAGAHGVGRLDMIENRLVGIKSREVYEAPAAISIIAAHKALEDLTLERDTLHFKRTAEQKYADLIYSGMWFSPLREALDAFFLEIQKNVKGTVRLKFFKGNLSVAGRRSPVSLYEHGLATYDKGDVFDHDAAEGFIELYGLPLTEWARKNKENK
jgi:argininosuccinate synthase